MLREHAIEVRVRYQECDPMGYLHHANYFVLFEMGRTELLRASGGNYRQMEEQGIFVVVVKADCRYHRPARYDDVLRIVTTVTRVTSATIEHEYQVTRDGELLATGHVVLAAVDRQGRIRAVPDWLKLDSIDGISALDHQQMP
ncbi:MAG: acyl-CoA thioesterase [Thermoguttaceae bacterium]|jgi:acyl-CoA thioester hydrolase|nr:acyl-CoA thioesterase [Thermoguttaceae bacterium]